MMILLLPPLGRLASDAPQQPALEAPTEQPRLLECAREVHSFKAAVSSASKQN